jgi:hypothetical protein
MKRIRQRRAGISPEVVDLWRRVRKREPGALLLLHRALEIRPWQIGPLEAGNPNWIRNANDGWERAIELRQQLDAALAS